MIYVNLYGRCGNQMFQYAMARKLQITLDDLHPIRFRHFLHGNYGDYNLKEFKLTENVQQIETEGSLINQFASPMQAFFSKVFAGGGQFVRGHSSRQKRKDFEESLGKVLTPMGIYTTGCGNLPFSKKKHQNYFLDGNFENPLLFQDIRPQLLEEFKYNGTIQKKNMEFHNKIQTTESVCITIRRGNFFSEKYARERAICTEEYWNQALKKMHELKPDATYFVFSDEVDWVKEHYTFFPNTYFEIDGESNSVGEKIEMMRSCKHFIISNSSFSWWAQWLGEAPDKIVIAPDRWLRTEDSFVYPLMDDSWINIPVNLMDQKTEI